MINLKSFGAVGDGVTDDTAAINAWLAAADATNGTAYAETGVYMHTGFVVPRDVSVEGESRNGTIFKMMDGVDSPYNIQIGGPRVHLKNFTVDGNRDNNTIGDGINSVTSGTYFGRIDNIYVKTCPGTGFHLFLSHSTLFLNNSCDRCNISCIVERSIAITLDTVDFSRFIECGLWIKGTPARSVVMVKNVYQEAVNETLVDAPFIKITSARKEDVINISGIYMNGKSDLGVSAIGILIEIPIFINNIHIDTIHMKSMATPVKYVGVTPTKIGEVSILNVSLLDGTPNIVRQYGVITDDSYRIDFLTEQLDLTIPNNSIVYPIRNGGPMRINSIDEMVTTHLNTIGTGTVNVGTDDDPAAFGFITNTNNTPKLTVTAKEQELSVNYAENSYNCLVLTVKDKMEFTGKVAYKITGMVY